MEQIAIEMFYISAEAIRRKQWIVVTGWSPRWMFGPLDVGPLDVGPLDVGPLEPALSGRPQGHPRQVEAWLQK